MIRVIYRWKVHESARQDFLERWRKVTISVHQTTEGAFGSFCLQDIEKEDEVLTVALWKTEAQWHRFVDAAKTGAMRSLHEIATQLSAKPYRQLGDETVSE